MNILLTGFEPFGGEAVNAAWAAVRPLDGTTIGTAQVHALEIPTVRFKSLDAVTKGIQRFDPEIIICVGQAGGRSDITLERVAINCDDYLSPDNGGNTPIDEPVIAGGPAAYFSTLPIRHIVEALKAQKIPAAISNTAGTFVCNHVFYGLMDWLARDQKKRLGGFIHVPYLPEQAEKYQNQPSLPLDAITTSLKIAIETTIG